MAFELKLPKLFGASEGRTPAKGSDIEMPTTQVMSAAPIGYDPLASASIMEQLHTAPSGARMPSKLPVIGQLPIVKQFQILGAAMAALFVLAAVLVFLDGRQTAQAAAASATATEMQMLSQRLARGTALAAQGQATAFAAVADSRERFKTDLEALLSGGVVKGVNLDVSDDPDVVKLVQEIKARWDRVSANAQQVIDNQQSLTSLAKGLESINIGNNALLDLAQQAAQQIGQGGGTLREIEYANQLAVLSQRIAKNANALASGDEIDPEVAFLLGKDSSTFREILNGLLKGSDTLRLAPVRSEDARATLTELQKRFTAYDAGVGAILQNMIRLVAAKQAARGVNNESEALLGDTTRLAAEFEGNRTRAYALWTAIVFAALGIAALLLLGKVFLDDARVRAFGQRAREQAQPGGDPAAAERDGQPRRRRPHGAGVGDRGRDRRHRRLDQLHDRGAAHAGEGHQLGDRRGDARPRRTRRRSRTGCSRRRSGRAGRSSRRRGRCCRWRSRSTKCRSRRRSRRTWRSGRSPRPKRARSRCRTRSPGMNDIRAQIQDTSKRIKRLGESSLEIGEIVELISDITEQTNVLALNAAIQAASAGEAGRGFTVVAEEVQRLAERSGEATKQIEAIVKTIQADTQDAVAAMEKSTDGVVEGAKLSDAAGQALDEIRRVSRELAELIGGISAQTQKQSTSVSDVTRGMQDILKITEETTEGTKLTNVSIGQLTRLAAELRSSVAGFKV